MLYVSRQKGSVSLNITKPRENNLFTLAKTNYVHAFLKQKKRILKQKLNFFIDGNIINSKGKDLYVFRDKYC